MTVSSDDEEVAIEEDNETAPKPKRNTGLNPSAHGLPKVPTPSSNPPSIRNFAGQPRSRDGPNLSSPHKVSLAVNINGYDIAKILQEDRKHYLNTEPPFVLERSPQTPSKMVALLLDAAGTRTDTTVEALFRAWDQKHVYRSLVIYGQEVIVRSSGEGQPGSFSGGYSFKVWRGHEHGLDLRPIACSPLMQGKSDSCPRMRSKP